MSQPNNAGNGERACPNCHGSGERYDGGVPQPCRCVEWPSGIGGAQCDECGRTTIVRGDPITDDPFGEPRGLICRPCFLDLWDEDDQDYEQASNG